MPSFAKTKIREIQRAKAQAAARTLAEYIITAMEMAYDKNPTYAERKEIREAAAALADFIEGTL